MPHGVVLPRLSASTALLATPNQSYFAVWIEYIDKYTPKCRAVDGLPWCILFPRQCLLEPAGAGLGNPLSDFSVFIATAPSALLQDIIILMPWRIRTTRNRYISNNDSSTLEGAKLRFVSEFNLTFTLCKAEPLPSVSNWLISVALVGTGAFLYLTTCKTFVFLI